MSIITVNVKIVKYNFHYSNFLDWKIGNVNAYILRIIWFVSKIPMETDWKVGKNMEYKINDICNNLSIGKSTIYNRINTLKQEISIELWKDNDYFYYTNDNKLFFKEKGFEYIKNFNNKNNYTTNNRQYSTNSYDITNLYQNHIIEIYKKRIDYLECENKRLLDIISVKEQKELANDVKMLNSNTKNSFFSKFIDIFRKE